MNITRKNCLYPKNDEHGYVMVVIWQNHFLLDCRHSAQSCDVKIFIYNFVFIHKKGEHAFKWRTWRLIA